MATSKKLKTTWNAATEIPLKRNALVTIYVKLRKSVSDRRIVEVTGIDGITVDNGDDK